MEFREVIESPYGFAVEWINASIAHVLVMILMHYGGLDRSIARMQFDRRSGHAPIHAPGSRLADNIGHRRFVLRSAS